MQQIRNAKTDLLTTKNPDMHGRQFKNSADAVNDRDLTTLQQVRAAITKATKSIIIPVSSFVSSMLSSLSTVGAIPVVTGPSTLGESTAFDSGTVFSILTRIFSVGDLTPQAGYTIWSHAGSAQDLGITGKLALSNGSSISGKNGAAVAGLELVGSPIVLNAGGGANVGVGLAAPNYPFEVQGDINTNGNYRVGGVVGFTGTILLAALTTLGTQGSITVVGGIITARVNPT